MNQYNNKDNSNAIKVCVDRKFQTTNEILRSAEIANSENIMNIPMVRVRSSFGSPPEHDPVRLAVLTGKRWQNGKTVKISFLNGGEDVKSKVVNIAKEWEKYANIKLQFIQNDQADIRISFKWNGDSTSWSWIGTDALLISQSQPTMNYGWLEPHTSIDEYNRVVLHEFGHALGCIHEHQSPVAGIPWDKDKVYEDYMGPPNYWSKEEIDHNLFKTYDENMTNFSEFDEDSIMIYPIPNEYTIGDFEIHGNKEISEIDKSFIQSVYPSESKPVIEITVDSPAIEAAIGEHEEVDLYSFKVDQQGQYTIETQGPTDVVMGLFGPNNQTNLIAQDDDSGMSWNAKMVENLQPGEYFLRVRHYRSTGTGNYEISVKK